MSSSQQPHFKKKLLSSALILICSTGIGFSQNPTDSEILEEEEILTSKPSIDLSKVVVTAGGFEQDVKDAPASISIVSHQDLEQAPFRDVTDAIKNVPGVVVTGGGASQDISIRGMGSQYTLMLVDGKRQNSRQTRPNSDGSGIEQGWVPPLSAIERIEVVRGPMSSRYGSDAMGGVINVITKKVSDQWGGNIRADYTIQDHSDEGDGINTEFYANGPLISDKLGLQIYGKYSHRDEDKVVGGVPERKIKNIGGKLTFVPIEGQTFELEAGKSTQNRDSSVGKTIAPFSKDRKGNLVRNENEESEYKRDNYSLRYLGEFTNGITSDVVLSHEKNNNTARKMIVKNTELSGNVIIPVHTHTITLGGQYIKEKLNDKDNQYTSSVSDLSRWNYALFAEDEWWLLDNFALTAGLRYNYDENYGGHITPRLYAVWNIDDAFTLKGGVSTGYTAPGLRQVAPDWGQITGGSGSSGYMILGNPNLKPEKTTNYEATLSYTPSDDFDASISAFYTKFKNKFESEIVCDEENQGHSCTASNGQNYKRIYERSNVDKAELRGLELAAKWRPIEEVVLTTSYTWLDTKQKSGANKGKPLNRMPKHVFNLHADWQANAKTNLWTQLNFRGKEIETSTKGGKEGLKYPSYTTFDIGATYQLTKDASIYAGVYNVFDKRVEKENFGKDLEGRRYWVGVSVDF